MDPISVLFLVAVLGAVAAEEERRKLYPSKVLTLAAQGDRLVFDMLVQRYRETGDVRSREASDWIWRRVREERIPGEVVSKVTRVVDDAIQEDRLRWKQFRSEPRAPRHLWIETEHGGHPVHLARIAYVDLVDLYEREGRPGLGRYNAFRDYAERWLPLELQYDETSGEFWLWIPTPDSPTHATPLRAWNTIRKKWPDFTDPEVFRHDYRKR